MTYLSKFSANQIRTDFFINGKFIQTEQKISKRSPIDEISLPSLNSCSEEDVDLAVLAAESTYVSKIWSGADLKTRKTVLMKLAVLMRENLEYLAYLDTIETGRPIGNFLNHSIPKAIEALEWFIEAVDKYPERSFSSNSHSFARVVKHPLGVVGLITPWNDPLVVSVWKFAPALLMGNSIVIKPSENSSYSILEIARLAQIAGIPDGVFNVITGYGHTAGKALALHKKVRGIFFTGSSETGKKILEYSAQSNMKKIGLECGGKSSFIVSKNCKNLQIAAQVLAKNIFYNQGQICSAPSRLLIAKEIKNTFLQLLIDEAEQYKPNYPWNVQTLVGSLINKIQFDKVKYYINLGIKEGGIILCGNDEHQLENGFYINPVIFDKLAPTSRTSQEEIFGPVLVVHEFETIYEAIEIANSTRYGLAASIWSDDVNESLFCAEELEAGIVHVNSYGEEDNSVPFGGFKESGVGRDKSLHAFDEYSETKAILVKLNS
jgi:acyl-CoA reductase-like NAD-dependent aldehyde dehydrogenase